MTHYSRIATSIALGIALALGATSVQASIDYTKISPIQLVKETPKGKLKNPYSDKDKKIVAEGHHEFLDHGCNGCHGGGGGGGMCPPLINTTWVYGGDDDTLFRQVTLGSDQMQKDGYTRIGQENVVGPMPPFGPLIKNSDQLWKIITFIRSQYHGDPANKYGAAEAKQAGADGSGEADQAKSKVASASGDVGSVNGMDTVHSVPINQ